MLLRALASFTSALLPDARGEARCYDRKYLANSAVTTEKNARQWLFQQCTELGWFQVHPDGDASLRLPRVNRAYFRKLCADTFGAELRPDTESATANYEAAALNASHVFFTFGKDDPWQSAYPVHGRADAAHGPFAAAPDAPGAKARHESRVRRVRALRRPRADVERPRRGAGGAPGGGLRHLRLGARRRRRVVWS